MKKLNFFKKLRKNLIIALSAICILLMSVNNLNAQVNVSGAHASSNGTYTTLKDAFDAINGQTQTGNDIIITITASTTETSSAAINAGTWNSVLMYPTTTGLSISGGVSGALIDFNGADNVTIDGRVNASGTTPSLTISNTTTGIANTIRFANGAESNIVRYATIRGSSTSTSQGVILFGSAGAVGNRNNVIEYCNITNAGGNRPVNGIYSTGSGSAPINNSNNTISNNNFFDLSNPGVSTNYIGIATNSPNWIISGNSFYESSPLTVTNTTGTNKRDYMIFINAATSAGSIISSNFIGGREPECGGLAYTVTGTTGGSQYNFRPIYINTSAGSNPLTPTTTIENNIIRNINLSNINSTQTGENIRVFTGIDSYRSNVVINNNQIGSSTGNSSIIVSVSAGTASHQYITAGITSDPPYYQGQITISNNIIGSIDAINTTANGRHDFYGIYETASLSTNYGTTFQITGNIIGGTTEPSIRAPRTDNSDNSASTIVAGIHLRGAANFTIANNTVRNIRQQSTGSASIVYGLFTSATSPHTIEGNEIYNITSAGTASNASTQGIRLQGQTIGEVHVRNNVIYNLSNHTTTTSAVVIQGIYIGTPATGVTANVYNNFIHSFTLPNSNPSGASFTGGTRFWGIVLNNGQSDLTRVLNVYNNVISLGHNVNKRISMLGIFQDGSWGITNNIRFNTIYIGGAPTGTGANTTGLYTTNANSHRNIENNIFFNARSGVGTHYGVYFNGTANTTVNYNNYFANGTGAMLAFWGADRATLGDLQTANGQDANSVSTNPSFASAGGTSLANYVASATMNGLFMAAPLDKDIVNNTRPNPNPKMGALQSTVPASTITAGIVTGSPFCLSTNDGLPINIPFSTNGVFNNGNVFTVQLSNASGSFASPVNIGTLSIGALAPSGTISCLIPKTTPAGTGYRVRVVSSSPVLTSVDNGVNLTINHIVNVSNPLTTPDDTQITVNWTNPASCYDEILVVASTNSILQKPFGPGGTYTANAAFGSGSPLLSSGFVVYSGTGTSVNVTGLTNGTEYCFKIFTRFGSYWSDGVQVCNTAGLPQNVEVVNAHASSNGFYATLKEAFDAINGQTQPSSNIEVKILASTVETASATLNAGAWTTMTIYPTVAGLTVTGSLNSALINFNGADNVTIDGRVNQSGAKNLIIQNTGNMSFSTAILFQNSAENNTIKYCVIRSNRQDAGGGVISFSMFVAGAGNNNNTITHCDITNPGSGNRPLCGIFSQGVSGGTNNNITISNNNFFDLSNPLTTTRYIHVSAFSPNWTITGNSFYETSTLNLTVTASGTLKRDYMIYIAPSFSNPPTTNEITTANAETSQGATISGNFFGGNAPECVGTYTVVGSATAPKSRYNYRAIFVNAGTTANTTIENNIIRNINISAINSSVTGDPLSVFAGIDIYRTMAVVNNNTIGSQTGNGSITVSVDASTASNEWITTGITYDLSTATSLSFTNNTLGSIDALNTTLNGRHDFYGIYTRGTFGNVSASVQITDNIIGGTETNSIRAPRTDSNANSASTVVAGIHLRATANFTIANNTIRNIRQQSTSSGIAYGIYSQATSPHTIEGNEIYNITSAGNSSTGSTQGIRINGALTALNIRNNTIYNLSNHTTTTDGVIVKGISLVAPAAGVTVNVYNNFIHSFALPNSSPMGANFTSGTRFYGIEFINGQNDLTRVFNIYNNVITLGENVDKRISFVGIFETGTSNMTNNIRFNTVYIGGTQGATAGANTACYHRVVLGGTPTRVTNLHNNIFMNSRSAGTGTSHYHYSVYFGSTNGVTNINYNNYIADGASRAMLAFWGADQADILALQTANSQDINSVSTNPLFATAGGTNATDYKGTEYFAGTPIVGITTDYQGNPRQATPAMGAFEIATVTLLTWNGNTNFDWNTASNWTPNLLPTVDIDVLIPAGRPRYPEIDNSKLVWARCKDMTINSGGKVTVLVNSALTVNGNMVNNGLFEIKSGTGGDGSLIIEGTRTGSGNYKIQRYFTGTAWHMIHSPVTNATASIFTNMFLRGYEEGTNSWGSYIVSPSHPLAVGTGVSVWTYDDFANVEYNGVINHGTIPMNVSMTGTPAFNKGYNLIGNPYPSAILWKPNDASMWSKTNISNTIQIWNPTIGNYTTWNGSFGSAGTGHLALGQGFFVQASGSNPSLSILSEARLHSEVPFKSTQEVEDIISVIVSGNNYTDECFIIYRADASNSYDFEYDAVKFPGLPEAPQLYSKKLDNGTEINLAVNALNNLEMLYGKLVYLEVGETTQYTLKFEHSMQHDFNPIIRDRFTDVLIYPNVEYPFTATATDNKDRFEILEFNNIVSVNTLSNDAVQVWEHNKLLYVGNVNTQFHITIYDILGKELMQSVQRVTNLETLPTGVYLVRVVAGNESKVQKISIH